MTGPTKAEQPYDQYLDVNYDVGQYEDGYINPPAQHQGDKPARPKMIWRKWQRNLTSENNSS